MTRLPRMRSALFILPLAALSLGSGAAFAQSANNQIIVSGTPIEESGRALAACIEQGCPPEEDIALTLAHAENQFIAGEYKDGEATLSRSLSRNRKHKDSVPVPLSDLYRASGRFAVHLGEARDFKHATLEMRDVLKDVFGDNDRRVLIADTEVGDSRAMLGFPNGARRIYEDVEKRALDLGYPRVASFARLRQALLNRAQWDVREHNNELLEKYEAALARLINEPLEKSEDFALMARVMKARLDRDLDRPGATDALIQHFTAMGGTQTPILLFSEPLDAVSGVGLPVDRRLGFIQSNTTDRLTTPQLNKPRFIDVGFWVRPDGTTDEAEVLRAQGPDGWHGAVIQSIASRLYAPLDLDRTSPGFFQVERYTITSRFAEESTGTRIRRREPGFRIERLDLTPENTKDRITSEG